MDFTDIDSKWDELTVIAFERFIRGLGWEVASPVSMKKVYYLDDFVMKFDYPQDFTARSHTAYEYRVWKRATPYKRRYFAKCLHFYNGLLFQERVEPCNVVTCECEDAKRVGHKLRIIDWYNHGRTSSGRLKFFDYDTMGSGWYNYHSPSRSDLKYKTSHVKNSPARK